MSDRCGPHPDSRAMPHGQCCDNHHTRPAMVRVLTKSDDTGKEYADFCDLCYTQFQADRQLDELATKLNLHFTLAPPVIMH